MSPKEKSQLLKFATSCPRPPLLGFSQLQPPLTIHKVRSTTGFFSLREEQRLPTASTCMNLLKLPQVPRPTPQTHRRSQYKTERGMREKLLYSISSGAGFELS